MGTLFFLFYVPSFPHYRGFTAILGCGGSVCICLLSSWRSDSWFVKQMVCEKAWQSPLLPFLSGSGRQWFWLRPLRVGILPSLLRRTLSEISAFCCSNVRRLCPMFARLLPGHLHTFPYLTVRYFCIFWMLSLATSFLLVDFWRAWFYLWGFLSVDCLFLYVASFLFSHLFKALILPL